MELSPEFSTPPSKALGSTNCLIAQNLPRDCRVPRLQATFEELFASICVNTSGTQGIFFPSPESILALDIKPYKELRSWSCAFLL